MRSKQKENSITYDFRKACDDMQNNESRKSYTRGAVGFAEFLREQGINKVSKIAKGDEKTLLQNYANHLIESGKRPSTVHTYMAGCCHALGQIRHEKYKLNDIEKIKRSDVIKGRKDYQNRQGKAEAERADNSKLVEFARCVGLRRSEYGKLTGGSLRKDESGYLCVWVKGKGGKTQPQRILPQHIGVVTEYMKGLKANEHLFSKQDLKNKIDLHSIRRTHARQTYEYYKTRLETDPSYKNQLQTELIKRWDTMHPMNRKTDERQRDNFIYEVKHQDIYKCRGETADLLRRQGREPSFNRLALLATSVFALSHWRSDVSVKNYLST